jgi:hypothetical protein
MTMRPFRSLTLATVVLALASLPAQSQRLPTDSLEAARRYARWFINGQTDSLITAMAPGTIEALGGRERVAATQDQLASRGGAEAAVIEERFVWRGGKRQYWRTVQMTAAEGHLVIRLVIDHDGKFGGYGISSAGNTPPTDSAGPPIRRP